MPHRETLVESDHRPVFATFAVDVSGRGNTAAAAARKLGVGCTGSEGSGWRKKVEVVRTNRACSTSAVCAVQ